MHSVEINVGSQKYVLRGDESEIHLNQVAELVRTRVEGHITNQPGLPTQKAAILAAFDLASELIKLQVRGEEYRATVLSRVAQLLDRVESELSSNRTSST